MLVANNPFFRNPLDAVTDEIRGRTLELPDFSRVGGTAQGPDLSSLSPRQAPGGNLLPPEQFTPLFLEASAKYGVPTNVLMALAQQESSYRPDAIGQPTQWGRAKGMMQYIDDTARRVGINPLDPAQAVDAAARQLRERLDRGYSMEEAIMAHHGGDNRSMWGPKTREYVEVVTGKAREIYNQAEGLRTPQEAMEMAEAEMADEGEAPFSAGEFEDLTGQERTELLGAIEAEMTRLSEFQRPSEASREALEAQAGEIEALVAQFEERRATVSTPEEVEAFNRDLGALNERLVDFERQREDYQRRATAFNEAQERLRSEYERVQQAPERRRSERPEAQRRIEGGADELSLEQIRELARDPDAPPEVDALSGAAPKYNDPNAMGSETVLDLVRQGLGAARDFLQTPASERELLSRRATPSESAPREPRPSGILGVDATGEARRARETPREVAQQYGRDFDKPDYIDAFTGAAPRPAPERNLLGWVENLSKSGGSGATVAVAGTIEGTGLILQQLENVEADRLMLDAARGLDTSRLRMAETLRMMEQAGRSDEEILRAVQPWAREMAKREGEFHAAVVEWAGREPNRVAEWMRGLGVDLGELAEEWKADPEYQGVATDIAAGVGSMLVYLGPGWLTTLMTKGSTAAIQAAASIAGASALAGPAGAAEAYQRAIDYGLSEDQSLRVAMAGIPAGIVQVAPVAVLLQRIPPNVRSKAVGQIRHILESFGAEFVAEGAGAVIQNFVEMSYNEETGLWDDSLYQAVIGGSSSALIALGINLASGARGVPGTIRTRNQTSLEASGGSLVAPEIMAARALDPWNYPTTLKEAVAARTPDAILDGHLTESAEGAPSGPLEGAMREAQTEAAVEAVQGERVSVATRSGDIAGTVESYTEDGQGGFRIRVLGDDGSMYTYTDADGVTVVRDGGQVAEAGRAMDAEAARGAPREPTPQSTSDPGALGLPPMAAVEAGEALDVADEREVPGVGEPADAAQGVGLPDDYVQRVQQRIDFLQQAETTQDVEDLIAAEFADRATADNALQINPERSSFLEAARARHAELSDTQRQARAGAPAVEAPADFQRDPSSPGLWRTPDAAIEFRESGFGEAVSFAAVDAATGETLARGSDMAELLARAQAEREARMVDGEALMEQAEPAQEEVAPTGEPLVRHTTRKGKELTGVLRDIPLAEAKAIDPYAFRKDGRSFIRVDRLGNEQQGRPVEESAPSRDNRETVTQDTDATPGTAEVTPSELVLTTRNTPFASFEKAERAMRNQGIQGQVVQIDDGWAVQRGEAPAQESAPTTDAITRDNAEARLAPANWRGDLARTRQYVNELVRRGLVRATPQLAGARDANDAEGLAEEIDRQLAGEAVRPATVDTAESSGSAANRQRSQQQAEPQWWSDMTPAQRYDAMQAAGIDRAASTPWSRLTESQQRALDSQWGEQAAQPDVDAADTSAQRVEETPADRQVSENAIFTEEAAEEARAYLKSVLGRVNTGLDPRMFQAGVTLAGYHLERGARTFAAYARAMVADLGDAARPYLKSWYLGLKFDPRAANFEGMDDAASVEAADVDALLAETQEAEPAPAIVDELALFKAAREVYAQDQITPADLIGLARIHARDSLVAVLDRIEAHPALADLTIEVRNLGPKAGRYSAAQHTLLLDDQFVEALNPDNAGQFEVIGADTSIEDLFQETITHELIHAVTARQIREDVNAPGGGKFGQRLLEIQNDIRRFLDQTAGKEILTFQQRQSLLYMVEGNKAIYEIPTVGLTNALAQDALRMVKSPRGGPSAWSKFVEAVRTLLGLPPETRTLLDDIMVVSEEVIANTEAAGPAEAAPEQVTMLTAEQMAELVAEYAAEAAQDPTSPFQVPESIVRMADRVKGEPLLTQAEAQERLESWKAIARAQGETGVNAGRIVVSLFEISGELSRPWVEAGYQVHTLDIQSGQDISALDVETLTQELEGIEGDVHAVLACPPCTDFSRAGAHTWSAKDADGRTAASVELVRQALRAVEFLKPAVWMMENPPGRLSRTAGIPHPRLNFQPHHFGDAFTKQTLLWGEFNPNLPTANVAPEGSLTEMVRDPNARSETPEGFAYAFFMANNAETMAPLDLLAFQFRGMDHTLLNDALAVGMTPEQVRSVIEDDYHDGNLDGAHDALRTAYETALSESPRLQQAPSERRVGESRVTDMTTPEGIRARMTELREDWAELAAVRDEQGMVTDARLEAKIRDIETWLAELRNDLARLESGAAEPERDGTPAARLDRRMARLREIARGTVSDAEAEEAQRIREAQAADPDNTDDADTAIAMAVEYVRRRHSAQQTRPAAEVDGEAPARPAEATQRPVAPVLRPEGRQRWRTERAAEKHLRDNDLLGVYVAVPEGKGFILERRAPYNLEIETRSYQSRAFGDEPTTAYETILHRPDGMSRELFVEVVRAKVQGAKKFLKNDTQVAIHDDAVGRLADHLQSNLIDRRDPDAAPPIPREEMPRDPGADTDPDTQSLVDSAPHTGTQAEPGADPASVDGARPDNAVGDGQPGSDRTGRADGVDGGAQPGAGAAAGGGRSDPRAGKSPANQPHGRTEDRPHQLEGENPGNFVITDALGLGEGTTGQKIEGNLAAIRLMKEIVTEERFATPAEQAVLARYVGWGGLKSVFDVKKRGKTDMYGRAQAELRALLTAEEYEAAARSTRDAHYTAQGVVDAMWRAARHFGFRGGRALEPTVGTGNFLGLQPADLAAATEWHAAELDSVTGTIARLLYPEANVLAATGFQDAPFANGVFRLAIGNPPFGELRIRDKSKRHGHLDGMRIHNYIIGKAGDHLAPGGVMQMVVTHRFLDTANPEARDYLAKHFRFLGAIRLPNDAFEQNAGTSVTTDIVFLQKLRPDEAGDANAAWLDVNGQIEVDGVTMRVNRYFQENPQHILGKSSMGGSMYRGDGQEYTVESDGRDIGAEIDRILAEDWADLEGIMAESSVDRDVGAAMLNVSDLPVGGMMLDPEGKLLRRDLDDAHGNAVIEEITPESYWREQAAQWEQAITAAKAIRDAAADGMAPGADQVAAFLEVAELALDAKGEPKTGPTKAEQAILDIREAISEPATFVWRFDEGLAEMEATLGRKQLGRKGYDTLRKLMDLRNRTLALIRAERGDDPAMDTLRQELNQAYDAFVANYGLISDPNNIKLLAGDIGVEVGLESGYQPAIKPAEAKAMGVKPQKSSAKKAAILSQRVAFPQREITSADSPRDALTISLSERGKLDLPYMSGLTGQPVKALIKELSGGDNPAIFYDPDTLGYEHAEAYLSGNVKRKLADAISMGLEANVRALEAVQPAPLPASRITPSMRGTWMPAEVFEDFLGGLGVRGATVNIIDAVGMIKARGVVGELTDLGMQFNDPDVGVIELFNAAAAGKSLTVWRGSGDERYVDKAASTRVTALAERMAKVFAEWAYSDAQRQAQVVDAFNRKMNTHRERVWDGEKYLKTVGQSPAVKLRRTQKNAAWRMIQSQNVLTDHVVGAGKTYTLITGIMERKRLGLSRKPMVVVPNHLVVQWASDFYQLYPGANILAATPDDFTKKNRRRLFARIATGDYDAVIVGHSSFGFIEPGEADTQNVIRERKRLLEQAMEDARLAGESKRTMRQMQNKLDSYDDRLTRLAERARDDIGITLEDMGVDYLAVDEAHEFKNLEYATSSERVVGMNDPKGSQRAFDLYVKVRGIQERQGGVAFATGTPVSNSLVELYTVMSYMATPELRARGLEHYDAWAGAYAVTETRMEYTATQKIKPRRVLAGLSNLESLSQLYRQFADVITLDDLKRLYTEEKTQSNAETGANERTEFPVPKVAAGGRQLDTSAITPQQAEFMDYLVARMQGIEANKQDPEYARIDNPLWVLSDARKMSLDIRTVDPLAARDENGKVMRSARRIKDIYDRWSEDRGTQLVFSDLSTPAKQAGKNARKIVREGLALLFNDKVARARMKAMKEMPFMEQWKQTMALADDVMNDPALSGDKLEKIEAFFAQAQEFEVEMQTADTGFSVYDDLREVLVEMGVPEGEIAFIHDFNTPEKKQRLFARVNAGAVRVLIGSTPKMGAGTNVQQRLVALHHLDAPWRPSDVEQREGRIIRQGNKLYERDPDGFEVEIHAYSTNGTSDTVMWQILERKAGAIEQFRIGGLDSMSEGEGDADQYAEFMASSTGNPVFRLKLEAERDLTEARAETSGRAISVDNAKRFLRDYPERKAKLEATIAGLEAQAEGDLSVAGETASRAEHEAVMAEALEAFETAYADYQAKLPLAEAQREKAAARGDAKLPPLPARPSRPHLFSKEVVAKSAYARLWQQALAELAAGPKDMSKRVGVRLGTINLVLERAPGFGKEVTNTTLYLEATPERRFSVAHTTAKPEDSSSFRAALEPAPLVQELTNALTGQRQALAELERRQPREAEVAEQSVDDSRVSELESLQQWYAIQVAFAEYHADIARGERENRYIAAESRRRVSAFENRESTSVATHEIDGQTYTTTGAVASQEGFTALEAVRDSDNRPVVLRGEMIDSRMEVTGVIQEPAAAREQMRSATAKSVAANRERTPRMGDAEVVQRLLQSELGETADAMIASGKIQVLNHVPANLPRGTQAYVDADGTITLVARNLTPDTILPALLHEAFHAGTRPLIGTRAWNELQGRLASLYRQYGRSTGAAGDFFAAARARIEAAEAAGDAMGEQRRIEEFGAYAIEAYEAAPRTLKTWVNDLVGRVKAWAMRTFGIQLGQVSPAQLRALAAAALRNGEVAASPALSVMARVDEGGMVDAEGNPVPESVRRQEVRRAVAQAQRALSVNPDSFVADFDSGVTRDIGRVTYWTHHPYTIASMEEQFTPVFTTAMRQNQFRDQIIAEMYPKFRAYKELPAEGRARVNRVLELGRLVNESYTDFQLRAGIKNPGFKTVVVHDATGAPVRRREPLNTSLSQRGDVIKLSKVEREAYSQLREMFDDALDLFRDQTLLDMGLAEFTGLADPAGAMLDAITDDMPQAQQERLRNMAQMAEEIEQAKRAGYVPLSRYGRFAITVRETLTDIEYTKNPQGGWIARGVPDDMASFMGQIGATYNELEGGWQLNQGQRKALQRETTRTVYSEKVEITSLRDRQALWKASKTGAKAEAAIPEVRRRLAAVKERWGGGNRTISVLDTQRAREENQINLADLDSLADLAHLDNETWDRVRDEFAQAMQGRGFRRHFFQSDNVPGYTDDFERAIADYMASMAGYLSRRHHQKDWQDAISGVKGERLRRYSHDYQRYVNDPAEEYAVLRQTGFLFYIAGNVSTAALNATQVPIMTMPILSQAGGSARAAAEVARAYKDALAMTSFIDQAREGWKRGGLRGSADMMLQMFDPADAPADVRAEVQAAWDDGMFAPQFTHEVMGFSGRRDGSAAARLERTIDFVATSYTYVERMNRLVTFIAAVRMAKAKGVKAKAHRVFGGNALARHTMLDTHWSPENFAKFIVNESQFMMGKANRSKMLRSHGAPIFQFMSFVLNSLQAWYRWSSLHGRDGKMMAAASVAAIVALSGVWGAPGLDHLRQLYEDLWKWITDEDEDVRHNLREWIYDKTGQQWIAEVADKGGLYPLGMDMSRRIGFQNILPETNSVQNALGIPADLLVGRPKRAWQREKAGDRYGAVAELLPNFAKNPVIAQGWRTQGAYTSRGDLLLRPDQIPTSALWWKSFGVQPTIVSDVQDYLYRSGRDMNRQSGVRSRFANRLARVEADAIRNQNPERAAQLEARIDAEWAKLDAYNERNPGNEIEITPQMINSRLNRMLDGVDAVIESRPRDRWERDEQFLENYNVLPIYEGTRGR